MPQLGGGDLREPGATTVQIGPSETIGPQEPQGLRTGLQSESADSLKTIASVPDVLSTGVLAEVSEPAGAATAAELPGDGEAARCGRQGHGEPGPRADRRPVRRRPAHVRANSTARRSDRAALSRHLRAAEEERRRAESLRRRQEEEEQQRQAEEQERREKEERERREAEERQRLEAEERARREQEEQQRREPEKLSAGSLRSDRGARRKSARRRRVLTQRARAGWARAAERRPRGGTSSAGHRPPGVRRRIDDEESVRTRRSSWSAWSSCSVLLAGVIGLGYLAFQKFRAQNTNGIVNTNTRRQHQHAGEHQLRLTDPDPGGAGRDEGRADLLWIPGGTFRMGRSDVPPMTDELKARRAAYLLWMYSQWPAHEVTVGPFAIDRTEVTNAEYAQFVKETGTRPRPASGRARARSRARSVCRSRTSPTRTRRRSPRGARSATA